ncbi:aminoacyl tRNA synthase complex-interacting multifunctional protein 2 [Cotesia typhae]|uniref:aminoacyl tRNA synthase complex-interacting multifunctional protein 2 n=1 Tax=Cotesia typhae TaxID=2053667 RepID=UPI003D69BB3F
MTIMYEMKAIINHNTVIERALCIYEMKNIHDDGDSLKHKCTIVSEVTDEFFNITKVPLAEVKALEVRQENILAQLAELKEQVLNLCNVLKNNTDTKAPQAKRTNRTPVTGNLVINVNPKKPCYSLIAVKKLWDDVDLRISPHHHCSIFSETLAGFEMSKPSDKDSVIDLSVIWRDVQDTQLIVSGFNSQTVLGETNILRYLVRLIDNESYEKTQSVAETLKIDKILDLAYELTHQNLPKDKQTTLNILDKLLGANQWFSSKSLFNIADIAVWSAVKQSSLQKLPSNLTSWYKKCEGTFL